MTAEDSMVRVGAVGVKVFGTAVIRVPPDLASIVVAVTRLELEPRAAFAKARTGATAVHQYLKQTGADDVRSSRVTLSQEFRYVGNEQRFAGYQARIGYNVVLRALDQLEQVLLGLIDAGANELTSVTFQTSQLKQVRADARRRAVAAAREKAELFCAAAGAKLGPVLQIEDANPDSLSNQYQNHVLREPVIDDIGEQNAIEPGAISVAAGVTLVFRLDA